MQRLWIGLITIGWLGLVACGGKQVADKSQTTEKPAVEQPAKAMEMEGAMEMTKEENVVYYTCPMESHKHVHSAEPGNCPECGMKMVPVVIAEEGEPDFYGCPMESHSHVRSDQPGKCPECGMTLKPMRLGKS
jgi:rubrerythrin